MAWQSRREQQRAVLATVRMLCAGAIILLVMLSYHYATEDGQPSVRKQRSEAAAMVQARWEAGARARMGVQQ